MAQQTAKTIKLKTKRKRKYKKRLYYWPQGWKPAKGKPEPPQVKGQRRTLEKMEALGHQYAQFVANPSCCSQCAKLDGRTFKLGTVLAFKYIMPHPNCKCSWGTSFKKSEDVELMSNATHFFHKAEGHPGLVQKVITNKLGRKQTVWVRAGGKKDEEGKDTSKPTDENKDKTTKDTVPLSTELKTALNDNVEQLRAIKPGSSGKVNGVPVSRHKDGKTYKVNGLVVNGTKTASVVTKTFEQGMATAGQTASGSFAAGKEMSQGGQVTEDVQKTGSEASKKASEVDAKRQQKARDAAKSKAVKQQSESPQRDKKLDKKQGKLDADFESIKRSTEATEEVKKSPKQKEAEKRKREDDAVARSKKATEEAKKKKK